MHEERLHLICEYQKRTAEACELCVSSATRRSDVMPSSRRSQVGELGGNSKYAFHGTGVTLTTSTGSIDFDFGQAGRANRGSPWNLENMAVSSTVNSFLFGAAA